MAATGRGSAKIPNDQPFTASPLIPSPSPLGAGRREKARHGREPLSQRTGRGVGVRESWVGLAVREYRSELPSSLIPRKFRKFRNFGKIEKFARVH
jgi:hypothetical protein